ncbi:hypothetical protein P9386_18465, partial [Caldifermentibacillus hisashii]|nr:hypothetical protein [Caldifermentibacillus hisashii]
FSVFSILWESRNNEHRNYLFITALQSLIDLFQTLAEAEVSLNMDIFKNQMNKWLATIPNYIKQCLNISVCES